MSYIALLLSVYVLWRIQVAEREQVKAIKRINELLEAVTDGGSVTRTKP